MRAKVGTLASTSIAGASNFIMLEVDTSKSAGTDIAFGFINPDVVIDWGDGNSEPVTTTGTVPHTYVSDGYYETTITGSAEGFIAGTRTVAQSQKIASLPYWGSGFAPTDLTGLFSGCTNLEYCAAPPPGVTTMTRMFQGASAFNMSLSDWDTSAVTDMAYMFMQATLFNGDISTWDVSNVTDMSYMLAVTSFNQDISAWDVSSVQEMGSLFRINPAFNQDISGWTTSAATTMFYMFDGAAAFNQDISSWDTSSVTDMNYMFRNASTFNQDLSDWNVLLVGTDHVDFDTGATSWVLPRPDWVA